MTHRPSGRLRWPHVARQWAGALIDLILPPVCGGCGKEGQRFCVDCGSALDILFEPLCPLCGYPVPAGAAHQCGPWPALAGIRSAAFFEGPLQHALHRLKYKRDLLLADVLAGLLFDAWRRHGLPPGVVVPIPLSAARLRERGYNQAGLLARGLADRAGLDFQPGALERARHTPSQVGLSARQRQLNVAGAFQARGKRLAGRTVLLIDDVCTTGATLAAGAQALQVGGASEVWGMTVARALDVAGGLNEQRRALISARPTIS